MSKNDLRFYRTPAFITGFLAFLFFSAGTIGAEIIKIDIRFAMFVEEINQYGVQFFPTLNGEPYTDYPVFPVLLSYLTSIGGHFINLWTLILPSILFGSYTVGMTCRIGEKLKTGLGLIAACLSFLCVEYLFTFMSFGIDIPVAAAAVTMLSILEFRRNNISSWCLAFPFLLIFSFCIRGPLGLLLVGASAAGWLFFAWDWKNIFRYGITGGITAILCALTGYYFVRFIGGEELWQSFVACQISSRMGSEDYLFYLINGTLAFLPGSGLAFIAFIQNRKKWKESPLFRLLGFILFPMIMLSIPGCKHLRYMTVAVPAIMLCGAWTIRCCTGHSGLQKVMDFVLHKIRIFLPPLILIAVPVLAITVFFAAESSMHWKIILSVKILLAFIPLSLIYFYFRRNHFHGRIGALMLTAFMAGGFLTLCIFPFATIRETSAHFVEKVESIRKGKLFFCAVGPDHEDLKYIFCMSPEQRKNVRYLRETEKNDRYLKMFPPILLKDAYKAISEDDLLITNKHALAILQKFLDTHKITLEKITSGPLGHRQYLVLKFKKNKDKK